MSARDALAAVASTPLDIQLAFSGVALSDAGVQALAPVLGTIVHLTSLDLPPLRLGAIGAASLAPAL